MSFKSTKKVYPFTQEDKNLRRGSVIRVPINKVAHGLGMQNHHLGRADAAGEVAGALTHDGDYHSDQSG